MFAEELDTCAEHSVLYYSQHHHRSTNKLLNQIIMKKHKYTVSLKKETAEILNPTSAMTKKKP